jgi:hypothetical protein
MIVGGNRFEFKNEGETFREVAYVSVTAADITKFVVRIDETLIDIVYAGAGGSHSWWEASGGKLMPFDKFPNRIPPGSTLAIEADKNDAAIRVDIR